MLVDAPSGRSPSRAPSTSGAVTSPAVDARPAHPQPPHRGLSTAKRGMGELVDVATRLVGSPGLDLRRRRTASGRCRSRRQLRGDRRALGRVGLILACVLEQLEHVAVRIAEEHLDVPVATRHRPARELDAVVRETRARQREIVDLEREVMRHPARSAWHPGPAVRPRPSHARRRGGGARCRRSGTTRRRRRSSPGAAPPRARAHPRRSDASGRDRRRRVRRAGCASPRRLP